ncbi:MAG: hypothetical protein PUC05_04045 [Firmicutes bacterium]|nr:hypothetical protein [Bacillota bacterium]
MKKTTIEVEELKKWGDKPCEHDKGYGHEVDDVLGCDCDCFCLQCGMRHSNADFSKIV